MRHPALSALPLAVAALTLGACGSSGPDLPKDIPASTARSLQADLTRAQQACQSGDSAEVAAAASSFSSTVGGLPASIDSNVRKVLTQGAQNLSGLARSATGCETGASGATGPTGALPNTSSDTASTPTKPKPKPKPKPQPEPKPKPKPKPKPPTTPETTTTTPTTTTPSTTTPPPPGGGGGGGQTGGGSGGIGPGGGKAKEGPG